MKNKLIPLLLIVFSVIVNEGFSQYKDTLKMPLIKTLGRRSFMLGEKELSEKKMHRLLLSCNDPEISKQVKRAKRLKHSEYIGFAAIPAAVFCAGTLWLHNSDAWLLKPDPNKFSLTEAASISGACTAVILTTTVFIKSNHDRRNATAIEMYNKKFN